MNFRMDATIRDRLQALLEGEPSRGKSNLREKVKQTLRSERKATSRDKAPSRDGQPPRAAHSAPPLEAGEGDREVLQMAGANFDSE